MSGIRVFQLKTVPTAAEQRPRPTGLNGGALLVWKITPDFYGSFRLTFDQPGDASRDFLEVREGDRFAHPFDEVWYDFEDAALDTNRATPSPVVVLIAARDICELPERAPPVHPDRVILARNEANVQEIANEWVRITSLHLYAEGDWARYDTDPTLADPQTVPAQVAIRAAAGEWEHMIFPEPGIALDSPVFTRSDGGTLTDSLLIIGYRLVQHS